MTCELRTSCTWKKFRSQSQFSGEALGIKSSIYYSFLRGGVIQLTARELVENWSRSSGITKNVLNCELRLLRFAISHARLTMLRVKCLKRIIVNISHLSHTVLRLLSRVEQGYWASGLVDCCALLAVRHHWLVVPKVKLYISTRAPPNRGKKWSVWIRTTFRPMILNNEFSLLYIT